MAEIQPQEDIGFSQKHPNEKLYRLDTAAIRAPFGFFYINPDVCSLIWKGSLRFYSLDQEVLDRLPSIIERGWKSNKHSQYDRNGTGILHSSDRRP